MTRSHPAVQADLAIYLFGELCVEIGGAPVKLNVPPKTIPLWVYLLLKRHASVSRTDLAARIWPDIPKAKARANLRRHLHHLQRMLPPHRPGLPWLIHDGEHIQWNPDADYWLDVGEFERLMAHNARLDQAVALYTGDVLPYLDDEWVFFERERLRLVYLTLLDSLVNYATARGDYAQAMTYAVRLVSQDPHREDASCRLMRLQYQAGDRAGVFAEYERLVTSLKQDLGLEPLPETVIFYKRLCQNDLPALDGCDLRAVGSYGIVDRLPFAGRNLEMAQMKSWWSQAVRGRGSVVLVQGQAGIGKTRIADELAAAVDPAWASVLRGTVTFGEPLSYQPILMALRAALPRLDTHALPRLRAATLMAVLPELKELYPDVQPLPVRDGDIDRKRLFDALVHCFFSLAKARPTLLIVEDMHWAGAATWAFLEYMAQQITPVPILVLVTCRDGEHLQNIAAQKAIARMGKRSMLRQLSLGPLAEPTIAGLLATASVPGAEVHTIAPLLYRISGGHPFFLGQLISHLAEGASPRDLPHDIHTVMRQRLDRLSPEAQQLAAVAAVIGTAFDIELLCEAGDWSESVLQPLVAELTERQLIREAGISAGYDYLFGHHVIQMAIYNRIPVATRARLHSRIGDLLEQVYDVDQPAIVRSLAGHFESAGQSAKAAAYYLAAARHAFSVYADEAAIDDASRGLTLTDDPQIQFELISVRVDSLSRCGNTIDQQPDLARLEQLAARAARTDAPHHALHRWIRLFSRLGESEAENQAIARLKAIADADRFPRWRAIALQHEGRRYTTAGRWDEARATLEAALGLFQSAGDPVGQVECLCYLTDMFAILVRPAEMNAYLEQAQAFLKTSNDPFMIIRILQATYVVQFAQQDSDANLAVGQRILDIAREIGDLTIEAVAHIYLGNSLVALGNLKETERHYAQALALYGAMADRSGQAGALINLGYLSLQLGLATQAMDYFNQAAETFGQIREWRGQLNSWCGFCRAALMKADYRQAHRAALKALEQARTLRLQSEEAVALLIAGCAERELGVLGESRRYLEAAVGVHRDLRQPVSLAEDLSELIATYVLMGERSLALAHADELLMLYNDHSDNLYAPQSALWAAAQAYALAEQPAVAADLLERAWAVMHEKAAALADPGMRESFLNLPKNRQILAAVRERRGVARTGA